MPRKLFLILLAFGLLTFRDYGYSWDEPLYYGYAEALPYAYTPANWFRPDFDLEKAYGPSPGDHKTRGPAYLLLAQPLAALFQHLGLARDEAWHLVNFLAFLLGLSLFHRLARRWFSPDLSAWLTALFALQPLLWGHAFINPKDPPFLFAFLAAVLFGLEMVDSWQNLPSWRRTLLAAFCLGFATVLRVIAPLAALLILALALWRRVRIPPAHLLVYLGGAALVTVVLWPYLWSDPFGRFWQVFSLMSNNVATIKVLFLGNLYLATALPRRYLPLLILITLTETTWLLSGLSLTRQIELLLHRSILPQRIGMDKEAPQLTRSIPAAEAAVLWGWLLIPLLYVVLRRPPMYDGYRHFLFLLPPVFLLAGLGLEWLFRNLATTRGRQIALGLLLLLPGIANILALHPYEYTYYNSLVGGTSGAFRRFETDYWLTCYKESVEQLNRRLNAPARLFVWREPYIAAAYAGPLLEIHDLRTEAESISAGDYLLLNTRAYEDLGFFPFAPEVLRISRLGATFCVVRRLR